MVSKLHLVMAFIGLLVLFLACFFAYRPVLSTPTVYNVLNSGAYGDGNTDDSMAFTKAWAAACGCSSSPTLLVPYGKTFLLSPLKFKGPCNSPIHVQVDGNIVAPNHVWKLTDYEHWISLSCVDVLLINGMGQFDGNGAVWWNCRQDNDCMNAPNLFSIFYGKNVTLSGLSFKNSPKMHVTVDGCDGVHLSGLTITAPSTSPNTDGIHIEASRHVEIFNSIIGTGDDCISIGNGTLDIDVSGITCGPGHGISIGSLGRDGSEAQVEQVHVSDCNIHHTTNGVRIKTFQVGSGYARDIRFERINFTSVERPIVIDEFYCDKGGQMCANKTSSVQVSDVHYVQLAGSAVEDQPAISIICSQNVPCTGIVMDTINIQSEGGATAEASCYNANGTKKDTSPNVSCLS